jgi:predicted PurR-regulated permease PerM
MPFVVVLFVVVGGLIGGSFVPPVNAQINAITTQVGAVINTDVTNAENIVTSDVGKAFKVKHRHKIVE